MPEHLLSLRMLHQDTSHQAFAGVCSGCGSRLGGTEATALLEEMARPPSGGGGHTVCILHGLGSLCASMGTSLLNP